MKTVIGSHGMLTFPNMAESVEVLLEVYAKYNYGEILAVYYLFFSHLQTNLRQVLLFQTVLHSFCCYIACTLSKKYIFKNH